MHWQCLMSELSANFHMVLLGSGNVRGSPLHFSESFMAVFAFRLPKAMANCYAFCSTIAIYTQKGTERSLKSA